MHAQGEKKKELVMTFETEELSPTQVRLVKYIHSLLADILSTEEEGEYFETSAALLKKTAELIKYSNFAVQNKNLSYGDQAVEFAVDSLSESMDENKIQNLDN